MSVSPLLLLSLAPRLVGGDHSLQLPAGACAQAPTAVAMTAHFDSSLTFTGAGSMRTADGATVLIWTGIRCTAWVRVLGGVSVDTSWTTLRLGTSATFVAHDEGPWGTREYRAAGGGRSVVVVSDRVETDTSAYDKWIAAMIREYVRRSGVDAPARAASILRNGGADGLLAEAREIHMIRVRGWYLAAAVRQLEVPRRAAFVRDGAGLLDSAFVRSQFLETLPAAWGEDPATLSAIYEAGAVFDSDVLIESLLRKFTPPRPATPEVRQSLGRLIKAVNSAERRRYLDLRYTDVP